MGRLRHIGLWIGARAVLASNPPTDLVLRSDQRCGAAKLSLRYAYRPPIAYESAIRIVPFSSVAVKDMGPNSVVRTRALQALVAISEHLGNGLTITDRKFDSAGGGGAGPGVGVLGGGGRLATHVGPPLRLFPPAVRRLWPISRSHPGTPVVRGPSTGNMDACIPPDPGLFKTEIENVPLGFMAPWAVRAGRVPRDGGVPGSRDRPRG